MKKNVVLTALCLIFINSINAQEPVKKNCIISGTITVSGVKDAGNIVVYLENVAGIFEPPEKSPVLDQKNLNFDPHVLPVLVGTTVKFPNSDYVRHNIFSPSKAKKFNLGTYSAGVVREVTFDKPGVVTLLCNVHTMMSAFIVVLENPYFTQTGPDGKFAINNVPPGTYKLKTWHEKLEEQIQDIKVSPGEIASANFKLVR